VTCRDQLRTKIIEMDYGMEGGELHTKMCAVTAGHIPRQGREVCSPDQSLRGHEYRLWPKDYLALYGVKNAIVALGYRSQEQQRLDVEVD
jgi:hypothetical protein